MKNFEKFKNELNIDEATNYISLDYVFRCNYCINQDNNNDCVDARDEKLCRKSIKKWLESEAE